MLKFKTLLICLIFVCLEACGGSSGGSSTNPSGTNPPPVVPPGTVAIQTQQVYTNLSFSRLVALLQVPGDSSRWYAVEQNGVIEVFDNDPGVSSSTTFVDISAQVACCGEMGLLGMAFHPNFSNNGMVFLNYTQAGPITFVSRFTSLDGGSTLDPTTELPLLMVPQDFGNHNGGNLMFGPDGFLYIGFGDGGSGNDPNNRAQDNTNLLGAMIRIDVDNGAPYGIPAGNPFATNSRCNQGFGGANCPEIFAFGLRNPWRWSFDNQNGDLWVADVGQNDWEEVNKVVLGGNYGWRIREGSHCNPNLNNPNCTTTGLIDPVAEYDHSVGNSITGGFVYRGSAIANLAGSYLYADFGTGRVFRAIENGQGTVVSEELLDTSLAISSFGQASDGELYMLDYGPGTIYQIIDAN